MNLTTERLKMSGEHEVKRQRNRFPSTDIHSADQRRIFYNGTVIGFDDPKKVGRVQIRIDGVDSLLDDKDLKWCINLTPSFIHVLPDIGEHVIVISQNPWSLDSSNRYFIGPILSDLAFGKDIVGETRDESMENFDLYVHKNDQ